MLVGLYLLCLLIVGYGVAGPLARGRSGMELFGMSACLGPGIVSLVLIALSMCGVRPSAITIVILTIGLFIVAFFSLRDNFNFLRAPSPLTPGERWWILFCILLIACAVMVAAWSAFINPTFEWDAFSIWQLKAKVLYLQPMTPRPDYFSDVSLSYSHLRYPLLVPMVSAGLHTFTGNIRDESGQSAFLISYIGVGAVVYGGLRDRRGIVPAITATTLLMTLPLLMRYCTSGTAEMALASFYACSVVSILNWQEGKKIADLILATLFSICMVWTKNEGIALAAINFGVILFLTPKPFSRRNVIGAFSLLIAVGISFVPWLIWSRGLPRTDEDYAGHLAFREVLSNFDRVPAILAGFINEMALKESGIGAMKHWGAFWMILGLLTLLQFPRLRVRSVYTLWILLLLQAGAYALAYVITPLNLKNLMADSMDRLILHLTPAAALIIGLVWPIRTPATTEKAKKQTRR